MHRSGLFTRLIFLTAVLLGPQVRAQEVQQHGLVFETWIRDTFFDGYVPPGYTQKWDIPAAINLRHGGVPVNPKAAKYRTPVDLGDALRQYDIAEPFILVIGYWVQDGDEKRFVNIVAPRIEPDAWRKLWGPVTRADLEKLDAVIKDRSLDYREARKQAQAIKTAPPFTGSVLVVNPKIDSSGQRRLQCSLRSDDLYKHLAPEAETGIQKTPALWGVPFETKVKSGPREFAK
ncbi:hypothetical protein [Rariglobus hedericola]|uniref:Uncharacterized protein n=1 Tax=Rariglobus hedericola TaxID=2597822 RepID=A0A556QGH4_9BACT|nr:hypothetical protein [Rariglobus hedericola]TSJ75721.1 hypothetical protein FPL22_15750 [Rariglobus hedericola]